MRQICALHKSWHCGLYLRVFRPIDGAKTGSNPQAFRLMKSSAVSRGIT